MSAACDVPCLGYDAYGLGVLSVSGLAAVSLEGACWWAAWDAGI